MSSYTESAVKTDVDNRFALVQTYSDNASTALNTFLTNMATQIASFTGTAIDFSGVTFPAAYTPGSVTGTLPTAPTVPTVSTPTMPDAPTLITPTPSFPTAPTAVAPGTITPALPSAPVLDAPVPAFTDSPVAPASVGVGVADAGDAPELNLATVAMPSAPSSPVALAATSPTTPILADIAQMSLPTAPTAPTLTLPTPSFPTAPTLTSAPSLAAIPGVSVGTLPAAPSTDVSITEVTTDSAVHTNLVSSLNGSLASGKLLDADAEQALYTRAVNRKDAENARIEDNATNFWASRGFEVPGTALLAAISQAATEQTRNNLEINAEILAKSGEMAMQNAAAVLQSAVTLEERWLAHIDSTNARALQAKVSSVEMAIRAFELEVQEVNYTMQASIASLNGVIASNKNAIDMYSTQLSSDINFYAEQAKTEVGRVTLLTDIEKTKTNLYTSSIAAVEAMLHGGEINIHAATSQAQVLVSKYSNDIQNYVAQVQAYNTAIQKYSVDTQVYDAGIKAESMRVSALNDIEKLKISLYEALVQNAAVESQSEIANSKALIDKYIAQIQNYGVTVQAESSRLSILEETEKLKLSLYDSLLGGVKLTTDAGFENIKSQLTAYAAQVQSYATGVQAETARVSVLGDIEKLKASLYDSTIKGLSVSTEAEIAAAKSVVDIYVSQLQGYASQVTASATSEQLKLGAIESQTKNAAAQQELILKQAQLEINEAANLLNIQIESLKAGAQFNAQIVASSLSSVNASANYGFSGGWNETDYVDTTKAVVSESIVHNLTT